jgi:predicted Zn-dependent peptidase
VKASDNYRKTEQKNCVRIVTEKLEHFRSVSLGIWVGAGSRDEDERLNGISHFIEHMIFKGTRSRSGLQIAAGLDAIGGLSNAFTGKQDTCFHSRVLDKHFPILADILSDIFLNSVFDPEEIDRERQVILQEISMAEDSPEEHIHDLFNNLFWINHPLGMPILGSGKTITAINRDSMLDHMRRYYTPDRVIIAAAGNIDHDMVTNLFAPLFESLEPREKEFQMSSPHINSGISCSYKKLEQVHILLGGKAPGLASESRFALAVLNTILGGNMSSRLFQAIREKRGLAYSVYSFLSSFTDTGLLGICVGTDPQKVNKVLEVISNEIEKIGNGEISEEELRMAKEHLAGGILLGAENLDVRMMRLAKNEYIFGRYIEYDEVIERLERVTIDEVIDRLREAFLPGNVSMATLGPIRKKELDLGIPLFGDHMKDN